MANILITEFMENEQIDIMSSKHNVSYEPEIYANSKALLDKSNCLLYTSDAADE